MNQDPQFATHLDADTLSAFADGALPAHEREAAAAHLARCGHCRAILQLALPPYEQVQPVLPLPARHGFAGWRWVWAGVAACAGAALVSVVLLRAPAPAPGAVAKVEAPQTLTPSANGPVENAPLPAAKAQESKQLEGSPASGVQAPAAAGGMGGQNRALQQRATQNQAPVGAPAAGAAGDPAPGSPAAPVPPAAPALPMAQPAQAIAANRIHGTASAPVLLSPPPAAGTAPLAGSLRKTAPAPPPADAVVTTEANSSLAQAANANASPAPSFSELPSGLQTASRYAQGQRAVAVDTGGTLFFSNDSGRHWTPAKAVWAGRVERVGAAAAPAQPHPQDDARAGSASLSGIVRDPSGAVVPQAAVTLRGSGGELQTLADQAGRYTFHGLAAGRYTLRVQSPGFETNEIRQNITAIASLSADVVLQPGAQTQTVNVAPSPAQAPRAPHSAALFALTTSAGERWVSADGRKWTRD